MDIISLAIQIISGVVGGNAAGMNKQGMGPLLNSILGGVGGVVLGQILSHFTGDPALAEAGASGTLDLAAIISSIVGGGAGGAILTFVIGLIKKKQQSH